MYSTTRDRRQVTTAVFLLLWLTGCHAGCTKTGTITGKVYYGGQVLTSGEVLFVAVDGTQRGGPIATDGTYRISKVPVGRARIAIITDSSVSEGLRNPATLPPGGVRPANKATKSVEIPAHYHKPESSGLEYNVEGGTQEHNIDLNKT